MIMFGEASHAYTCMYIYGETVIIISNYLGEIHFFFSYDSHRLMCPYINHSIACSREFIDVYILKNSFRLNM
jgi:hypothetical protein